MSPASFPPDGGSGTLRVTTARECTWTTRAEASWIALSRTSGQGDDTFEFKVAANESPDSRAAALIVNDQPQQISQQGRPCEFSLSSVQESVPSAGGERTIDVDASSPLCTWTAAAGVPWITIVSGAEGSGEGEVTFRVDPAAGPPRTGTLTVAGRTVQVEQGTGCSISVNPAALNFRSGGGEEIVRVTASNAQCAWSATASAPWVTLLGAQGTGSAPITVGVAATTGPPRSATITVAGRTVQIQQGSGCAVGLTPASARVPAAGGATAVHVSVAAGCGWTASADSSWITVASGSQGSGPGRVDLTIAPNSGPERRGTVTIGGREFDVAQANGCIYILLPPSAQFEAGGGNGNVLVIVPGPCTWTARSTVNWIRMTAGFSGTGNGLVQFVVSPNPEAARTGFLTIAGLQYRVAQSGR